MTRVYSDLITVNGVDVKAYVIRYEITQTKDSNTITTGNIELSSNVIDALIIKVGQDVIISRGVSSSSDQVIIRGFVESITFESNTFRISVTGRLAKAGLLYFTKSYDVNIDSQAGEISAIATDILEDGGFTVSSESSGTGAGNITLNKFVSNDQTRLERVQRLISVLNWQMYDDYTNNYIRLEPVGYSFFATQLVVGGNVVNIPVWDEELSAVRNKITVNGAFQLDTKIESFSGDGAETEFTVENTPESVEVKVGGTLQVLGNTGAQSGFDYSLDRELKTFTFESGSIPGVGVDNVVITYTTRVPRPVTSKDSTSITLYNQTREAIYDFDDIVNVADAETRVSQLLKFLGRAPLSTLLKVNGVEGIIPGKIVDVVDSNNSVNSGNYIVLKVSYNYPSPVDFVSVGVTDFNLQNVFNSIDSRLNELETQESKNVGILTQVLQSDSEIGVRNQSDIWHASLDTDVLYWDDDNQGTWGNDAGSTGYDWGDDVAETLTLNSRTHTNKTFLEDFWDSNNVDSGSTTATVNTTAHSVSFTDGQVLTSGTIFLNTTSTFQNTNFRFSIPTATITGSLTYEVTADNSIWQSVTLGTPTEFTFNGSPMFHVKYRITSSGNSSITCVSGQGVSLPIKFEVNI